MKRSFSDCQNRLFETAQLQGGFFTATQAEEAGFARNHHDYHVHKGNWERVYRGIYRLTRFPLSDRPDLIQWSLWSRGRSDHPQGVYSHQTALSIHDLTDLMPPKLHMTVPTVFRRSAAIPSILILYYGDLPPADIEEHEESYFVTRPTRTILDLYNDQSVAEEILVQAISEGARRGLITAAEMDFLDTKIPTITSVVHSSARV